MRRSVHVSALLMVCAILAAPTAVEAQSSVFVSGNLGATAGTFGSRPAGVLTLGSTTAYDWMSFGVEFGMLPGAEFEKADRIVPGVSVPGTMVSDVHVNKFHYNGNLFVRPFAHDRLRPYATVGIGGITGRVSSKDGSGFTVPDSSRTRHNPAVNVGAGTTVPITSWMGVNVDYRHFIFMGPSVANVNRFMGGVSFFTR